LVELRDQGVIRAVGAGMNFVAPLRRIVAQSDVDIVMVAGRYTLLDRSAEVLLEQCAQNSVAVAAAAPFNSGLLARRWPADDAHFDYAPAAATVLGRAREYAQICEQFGVALPQAAIQFPLRHSAVTSVVTGMRTSGQVQDAMRWMRSPVPEELWRALDELARRQA
jgi:D-threo-aldose 1-dehydrogenase